MSIMLDLMSLVRSQVSNTWHVICAMENMSKGSRWVIGDKSGGRRAIGIMVFPKKKFKCKLL